jgi:hypothetical protein
LQIVYDGRRRKVERRRDDFGRFARTTQRACIDVLNTFTTETLRDGLTLLSAVIGQLKIGDATVTVLNVID